MAAFIAAYLSMGFSASTEYSPLHTRDHYAREFSQWQLRHGIGLNWSDDEYSTRLDQFIGTSDKIELHNQEADSGKHSYRLAHNQFSHLTHAEWRSQYLMSKRPASDPTIPRLMLHAAEDTSSLSTSVDWVAEGAVTGVKSQGSCGCCWAFSTTGAIEGARYVKYGSLESLSEQQLVDCDTYDSGCDGGLMDNAFQWIKGNGGLCSESSYPFTSSSGKSTGSCSSSCSTVSGTDVSSYTDVAHTESALMTALSQQPVSVAIEADQSAFMYYSSGVLTGTCGTSLDHGVLAVGYGTDASYGDYWLVKNSWDTTWGEDGYVRIERDGSDKCGILLEASYPTVA